MDENLPYPLWLSSSTSHPVNYSTGLQGGEWKRLFSPREHQSRRGNTLSLCTDKLQLADWLNGEQRVWERMAIIVERVGEEIPAVRRVGA